MFTTHGEAAIKASEGMARLLDAAIGFGFAGNSEQRDIDAEFCGCTVALPSYVTWQIHNHTSARIVPFSPGAWWNWQDQWVLRAAPADHAAKGRNRLGFIAGALHRLRKSWNR